MDEERAPSRQESMGGLSKGLSILEGFGPDLPRMSVTDAARASGTTPAAARRCLITLTDLGYLFYDGKYYSPSPRIMRLTSAYSTTNTLPSLAQPRLDAVRDELMNSASLAVLSERQSLFVARADAARIVSAGVRVGSTLPLWASATGRILAGGLSAQELDEVLAESEVVPATPRAVKNRDEARAAIELARAEGVAYTDEELEYGVRTMAVPVSDAAGVLHGAMSVSAFVGHASLQQMREHFLPVLSREAGRLGRML